jgi:hypothetical protein
MPMADREVALRIVVRRPPSGVAFAVQRGAAELVPPSHSGADALVFDVTVRVGAVASGGAPRFLGAVTQGPPSARFVYVNSGKRAGQASSCWDRRAKVPLAGITLAMVDQASSTRSARIETEFPGTGPDGGPTCASVKGVMWHVS